MSLSRASAVALWFVLGVGTAITVDGQSTVGQYGTAKYRHRCSPDGVGSRCQYTVTLPDCSAELGEDLCSSPEDQDRAILMNLLDLVNQQTAKIDQLSEAVERLSSETSNSCSPPATYKDCNNVAKGANGTLPSGVYRIRPDGIQNPFDVFCEISESEAWTVFQRRINGSVDFYRNWADYKAGFGEIDGEHWLGNDNIHALTTQAWYKLRIDLEDWDGSATYAEYDRFWIEDETGLYTLHLGDYTGTAGDAMKDTNNSGPDLDGHAFSTYDMDNDAADGHNCAVQAQGAWWYNACQWSNLNGVYSHGGTPPTVYSGIRWSPSNSNNNSRKTVTMKIQIIQ